MKTTSSFLFAVLFFCSLIWMGQACQSQAGRNAPGTEHELANSHAKQAPAMATDSYVLAEEKSAIETDPAAPGEHYKDYGDNPFTNTLQQPVSTFALDADGAGFVFKQVIHFVEATLAVAHMSLKMPDNQQDFE